MHQDVTPKNPFSKLVSAEQHLILCGFYMNQEINKILLLCPEAFNGMSHHLDPSGFYQAEGFDSFLESITLGFVPS